MNDSVSLSMCSTHMKCTNQKRENANGKETKRNEWKGIEKKKSKWQVIIGLCAFLYIEITLKSQ